jgi:hypothetical protein
MLSARQRLSFKHNACLYELPGFHGLKVDENGLFKQGKLQRVLSGYKVKLIVSFLEASILI